ncbi:MAG: zinc-dependent metalloprotease, partial [Planctomycetota bacterium]
MTIMSRGASFCFALATIGTLLVSNATAQTSSEKRPEFPPLSKITEGYEEVKVEDNTTPFFKLWKNDKTGNMLAQLPKDYASSKSRHFIAPTVSGGEVFAGLQSDAYYVYWRQYGKRVALIQENLEIKGSDDESKSSVKRLFTDKVLLSVPILTMQKGGGPVIDLDGLLVGNARTFFGSSVSPQSSLIKIKKAKAFPKNIEVAFEVPMFNGSLKTLHYSISKIQGTPGYKPRKADQRIGYFTTSYDDYGKYDDDDTAVRYINRWHLEKRKPELKLSPPKKPIVFYIEHTTPVRYRRWVREGILSWNKAFEKIGIINAVQVYQQDPESVPSYMDLDPEDVRYNFVRWLNNNISTAIGPSRANPLTGEILDADIVLTDGWIRVFEDQFSDLMPKITMDGMTPETLDWFAKHPDWDPRIRLAEPSEREFIRQQLAFEAAKRKKENRASWDLATKLMGDEPMDGIVGRQSQTNGACMAAEGRGFDVGLMRMAMALKKFDDDKEKEGKDAANEGEKEEEKEQMLDGMPESFIGPLLADLVAHEVGHTLGLRHNFKASSIYTLAEINSEEIKGKKPFTGSVMDYNPTNFYVNEGEVQGDFAMIEIGPYDYWAIEYGYTLDPKKLDKILSRVAEPELAFCTDEDTFGPDPLARRYDFSKDPLDFAQDQVALATQNRDLILEKFVKDGDAWAKARRGYLLTLSLQTKATSMMSNWLGGTFVYRDKKGDPNGRKPIEVVPAEQQRAALEFVIENTFYDEAFGLTPELLSYMTSDYFGDFFSRMTNEPAWPV